MSEPTTETTTPAVETTTPGGSTSPQEKLLSQAEVDEIVKDRLKQQAKNQFGDYAELKARADGAKTLEERLGTLETELSTTKLAALRTSIAARFGISTEKGADDAPSDADLFLTGSDEATLTAQATRLAAADADRKARGNVARREGDTRQVGKTDSDLRTFAQGLFGKP